MHEKKPLDVKKIMENIKGNIYDEKKFDIKLQKQDLKFFLSNLVEKREKSSDYLKIKNLFNVEIKKELDLNWSSLEHNLHLTNKSVEINEIQPILTNRNKLVKQFILKIRNVIQSEIRFTLNPIIRNQISFNAFSAKTLNEIKNFLKNQQSTLDNQQSTLDNQQSTLDNQQSTFDNQQSTLNNISNDMSIQKNDINRMASEIFPDLNWNYLEFENKFRGDEHEIKKRFKKYISFIQQSNKQSESKLILDVGTGRGEFLELLNENNIPCIGIETNPTMYEFNKTRKRNILNIDVNGHLLSVDDNTLLGITAFQVIEHLSPEYFLNFLKLSFEKISSGGLIILETINPMSFFSFSHFWYDLSHKKPIPPDILKFYAEAAGFKNIEIIFSGNVPEELTLKENDDNMKKLNQFLFGPQDYALIGWKK